MQNFQYQIPTKLLFGENCINSLPFLLEKFGRNILLVYGCGSIKRMACMIGSRSFYLILKLQNMPVFIRILSMRRMFCLAYS